MCSISLCMIVKNEEKNIRRCLDSAKAIVDEIIIVDTGSQDKTIEICEEYGAKVYQYTWEDDFSTARNFSVKAATSQWILWMDADEELLVSNKEKLNELLKGSKEPYFIKMTHFLDSSLIEMNQNYISFHNRLFPNNHGYFFKGTIHERLTCNDKESIDKIQTCELLSIHHYGYQKELAVDKALRNLKLLLKARELEKENPWIDYYIGSELYRLNDADRAFHFINHAISMFLMQNKLPPALLYKLKYDILIHSGNMENAIKGIEKVIELYSDYVELHFYHGMILFRNKQFEESLKAFSYCIVLGEFNPNYLIQCGNGSFCAGYYMGRCYEELGKIEHAIIAYEQSLHFNAFYKPSLERLEILKKK